MIKPSFIFALFGILVVMAVGFMLVRGDRLPVESARGDSKKLETFDTTKIEAITIKKGDVTIAMEKKDKKWQMTSQKTRAVKVERVDMLLSNINMAKISRNNCLGQLSAFDLDEANRTVLTLDQGSAKIELILGKTAEAMRSFVKKSADGDILEIDKSLDTDAGVRSENDKRVLDPSYFYDLTALNINADDLIEVAIKKGHETLVLQKVIPGKGPLQPKQEPGKDDPKPVWWITEPDVGAVDDSSLARLTAQTHFNAKAYADTVPEKERGFDKPSAKIKLRVKDGTEYSLVFGKVDPSEVLVQVEGQPDPYKVDKYIYDALTQDLGELKKKEAPEAPKPEGSSLLPQVPGMPPGMNQPPVARPTPPPEHPPDMDKKPKAPVIPPALPPQKVEDKPALPPAVVKPPEQKDAPKPDDKTKTDEKK